MKTNIMVATFGALALASSVAYAGPPAYLFYTVDASFDASKTEWTPDGITTDNEAHDEWIQWGDQNWNDPNSGNPSADNLSWLRTWDHEDLRRYATPTLVNGIYQYQPTDRLTPIVAALWHHNVTNPDTHASLTSTVMTFSIDILGTTLTQDFDIYFSETPNYPGYGQTCAVGSGLCADILVIDWDGRSGTDFSYTFDPIISGGYEYVVTLNDNDFFHPLSQQACAAAGASAGCIGFATTEKVTTTGVEFGLSITASPLSPVPEPETYAMLLAGLGIVSMAARRRRGHIPD